MRTYQLVNERYGTEEIEVTIDELRSLLRDVFGDDETELVELDDGIYEVCGELVAEAVGDVVTWTASNDSSVLDGERDASSIRAAVRDARRYIRGELNGEGKATICVNGRAVREDEKSIFTGHRWEVRDLTK